MSRVHFRYKQIGAGKITDFNASLIYNAIPGDPTIYASTFSTRVFTC